MSCVYPTKTRIIFRIFDCKKLPHKKVMKVPIAGIQPSYSLIRPNPGSVFDIVGLTTAQSTTFFSDQNNYVDSNPAFHIYTDIDYDFECGGISRASFIQFYGSWIAYVYKKIKKVDLDLSANPDPDDETIESNIFTLCFALSLMGRKALASASHQGHGAQEPVRIELFLHGLHSLFQVI